MKFTELNPHWVGSGGDGISRKNDVTGIMEPVPHRAEVGISFDCPCGCATKCFIHVKQDADGNTVDAGGSPTWNCADRNFETFTLSPSIRRHKVNERGCNWHGFIKKGLIEHCGDARNDKGEPVR